MASPRYDNSTFDSVPLLDAVAILNQSEDELTMFAVNRSQEEALALQGDFRSLPDLRVVEHLVLEQESTKATNTSDHPDVVGPHNGGDAAMEDGRMVAHLPKLSWNAIRLERVR